MKNPIELTALMFFSIGYFAIGFFNWVYKDPDFTYWVFSLMNNYHMFEISLLVALVFSIRRNYQRAKGGPKTLLDTALLVAIDFVFMLLGLFASNLVLLTFTYTQNNELQWIVVAFTAAVMAINIGRKSFLNFLACRLHRLS